MWYINSEGASSTGASTVCSRRLRHVDGRVPPSLRESSCRRGSHPSPGGRSSDGVDPVRWLWVEGIDPILKTSRVELPRSRLLRARTPLCPVRFRSPCSSAPALILSTLLTPPGYSVHRMKGVTVGGTMVKSVGGFVLPPPQPPAR